MSQSTLVEPSLHIEQQIDIEAPKQIVFESVLEELGPGFEPSPSKPMNMTLEAWPGGRWFRDLGNNAGHLWGHVQVIKPPTLIEICGPMFMSFAAINHLQWRLTEQGSGTRITFTHRAIGDIPAKEREGMKDGWREVLEGIAKRAKK